MINYRVGDHVMSIWNQRIFRVIKIDHIRERISLYSYTVEHTFTVPFPAHHIQKISEEEVMKFKLTL